MTEREKLRELSGNEPPHLGWLLDAAEDSDVLTADFLQDLGFRDAKKLNLSPDYQLERTDFVVCVTLRATPDVKPEVYVYNRESGVEVQVTLDRAGYKKFQNTLTISDLRKALEICAVTI
jgi:hypothetical protein